MYSLYELREMGLDKAKEFSIGDRVKISLNNVAKYWPRENLIDFSKRNKEFIDKICVIRSIYGTGIQIKYKGNAKRFHSLCLERYDQKQLELFNEQI